MKILFLTSRLPFPPIGGDKLRTFNFIKHLKQRHELTVLSLFENDDELSGIEAYGSFYDKLIPVRVSRFQSYYNCVRGLFSSLPLQVHYYHKAGVKAILEAELQQGYDAVICHLIRMAQYLPENGEVCKVVDFTDAISLNYIRSRRYRKGLFSLVNAIEAHRVLQYEKRAIAHADRALFVSDVDAEFLSNGGNEAKITVVPNGVDLQKFAFYDGPYDENKIAFVGNMRTFPNTDAVCYFVAHVFPMLQRARPGLKFYIVGNAPTKQVSKLHDDKHIFVTGYVESTIPYVRDAAAVVAPMRVGAGIQNKILEALALGTPVVGTSIAAEGLQHQYLSIGDTPAEISRAILDLLENRELRRRQAATGREYVEQSCSWQTNLMRLDSCLENVTLAGFLNRNDADYLRKDTFYV